MYEFLKTLLNAADEIGYISEIRMDPEWSVGRGRIDIIGATSEGFKFTLCMEVEKNDGRN